MAKKKAQKKKKQQARAKAAPKPQVPAVDETSYVESDALTESVESDKSVESIDSGKSAAPTKDWSWQTYAILALAAAIILFAGWLVIRSLTWNQIDQTTPQSSSGSSPIPLSGEANPQQLQAGTPEVQPGGTPDGASSSENNGLQEPQPLTPEQLQGLQ